MISLKTHNVLDYVNGASVAAFPLLFPKSRSKTLKTMSVMMGLGEILYSSMTRYPFSIAKVIPLGKHLVMDSMSGLSVAALPFIARARGERVTPAESLYCISMGAAAILNVAMVNKKKEDQEVIAEAFDQEFTPAIPFGPTPSRPSNVINRDIEEMDHRSPVKGIANLG